MIILWLSQEGDKLGIAPHYTHSVCCGGVKKFHHIQQLVISYFYLSIFISEIASDNSKCFPAFYCVSKRCSLCADQLVFQVSSYGPLKRRSHFIERTKRPVFKMKKLEGSLALSNLIFLP